VFALDDDASPGSVDDLFHQNVTPLVGRPFGLPHVLVAEIPKDVLGDVLELESGEVVENGHPGSVQPCRFGRKYVPSGGRDSSSVLNTEPIMNGHTAVSR